MLNFTVNPADIQGRHVVITGANTGIGRVTAVELVRAGAHVTLANRSRERSNEVIDEIKALGKEVEFVALDLGSFESVRRCADALLARDTPIDVLINNAGLAGARGLTADGFEMAFGVNHLGPFLLTLLLLPRIRQSSQPRIVNVASRAHTRVRDFSLDAVQQTTKTTTGFPEYSHSKLANVLFSAELARKLEGTDVHTYALHPGVVASDVWRKVPWPFRALMKAFMITNAQGAMTTLYCATSAEVADHTGRYYDECREAKATRLARDPALAADLWAKSLAWTGAPDAT